MLYFLVVAKFFVIMQSVRTSNSTVVILLHYLRYRVLAGRKLKQSVGLKIKAYLRFYCILMTTSNRN